MESNNPLISVILPVYNVENYIEECLISLKNQTYDNFEVIIVNDGSTDSSLFLCEKLVKDDSRFVIFSKTNGGLSDARNFGMSKAHGEYYSFIDSDDYVSNDYLEYLYKLIKKNNTKIAIASHTIFYENGMQIYKGKKEDLYVTQKETLKSMLLDDGIDLSAWGKLYEASLFDDVKYPIGVLFEDTATTYKLIFQCDFIAFGCKSIYFYRIRNNSITTCSNFLNKIILIDNTIKMANDIVDKYSDLKNAANRRVIWAYFSTLNQLIKCNNINDYKKEYNEIRKYLIANRNVILKNNEYSKRDKFAIISFSFGLHFYKFSWKIYQRLVIKNTK